MVTLEQYKEARAAYLRRTLWLLVVCFVFEVVFIAAIPMALAALLRPYEDAAVEAAAQWVVRHDVSPWLILLIALPIGVPICLVLALPVIAVLRVIDRRSRQDRRLFCPHCDAALSGLVILTGNCHRCGKRALDLPEGSTTAIRAEDIRGGDHRLLTLDEYAAAIRDIFKRDPNDRDPNLSCPRCQARLAGRPAMIVATRKCPSCATTILEDPESTPPTGDPHVAPRRLSLAGFRAAHQAYLLWTMFGLLPLAGLVFFATVGQVGRWQEPLIQLLGELGYGALVFATFILGACLTIGVAGLADHFVRKKLQMNCPHCGQLLYHSKGIVIATHRCFHCGRRALAEEDHTLHVSAASEP